MQTIPYVGYSLYQLFLMFCFWSFIGWCIEVIDMTYETGEYQNRGFLNMPICPIEGLGVIMVTVLFKPISNTIVPLFLACTILCTAFELFVGWGMEKIFHARWWDYSNMKFNYKGYICLRNSIFFGAGCVVVIRYIQPMVEKAIDSIPLKAGITIVIVMSVLIAVDTAVSLMAVKKLNEKFRRIDEISKLMLSGSVKVGMKLASGTLKVKSNVDKIIDVKDNVVEKVQDMNAANMDRLKSEYSRLIEEKDALTERLAKTLITHKYSESLSAVKDRLKVKSLKKDTSDTASDENISEENE
ncbi:MAG: putative ABC transporter permease [Oscillospiraceae bacterium]|nr:putative ABC transporter permease [Oscillospiraceae bacterium]MDD7280268.1 putative ABC transporter permease [Oscillospiraceae bacterium]MDY2862940.1 putative ABC transporter permease [Oscillospiraceae bacterium]